MEDGMPKKYMFKCQQCLTVMSIETSLEEKHIHMAPPCPCGKSRFTNMSSYEYAYGYMEIPQNRNRETIDSVQSI